MAVSGRETMEPAPTKTRDAGNGGAFWKFDLSPTAHVQTLLGFFYIVDGSDGRKWRRGASKPLIRQRRVSGAQRTAGRCEERTRCALIGVREDRVCAGGPVSDCGVGGDVERGAGRGGHGETETAASSWTSTAAAGRPLVSHRPTFHQSISYFGGP